MNDLRHIFPARFINLTPHRISIHASDETILLVEPSGAVARCAEERTKAFRLEAISNGLLIEVTRAAYGHITNLPDMQPGVFLITSALVAQAAARGDVLCPGPAVRDEFGNVIGCLGLSVCN